MPPLTVLIVHGALDEANYPLLIGHATGTPISGAESRCDDLLSGELTNLQMLGLYPERAGESRYVRRSTPEQRLRGCLILGLDSSEPLMTSTLIEQVERAVLDYAVHEERELSAAGGDTNARPRLGLSAVPVGSGPMFDLSPERSSIAVVRGVQRVNEALCAIGHRVIEHLELIDRYAARVEQLVRAMKTTVESQSAFVRDAPMLAMVPDPDERPGARSGNLPPGYDVGIWEGLSVEVMPSRELDDRVRYLSYRFARNRAAVGVNQRRVDRDVVADLLSEAVATPSRSVALGQVLLEELLPIEVIDELSRTENLVLQVDARTADIPWELLGDRVLGVAPLACRSGLLRQFRVRNLAVRKVVRRANTALVFGDPPTNYHPLPAAREEAEDVAGRLNDAGVDVHHLAFPGGTTGTSTSATLVRTALRERDHRIIHIAAHGLTEVTRSRREGSALGDGDREGGGVASAGSDDLEEPTIEAGIAIGPGSLLVADDFRNLRMAPEFVFLNCCHLGRARVVEGAAGDRLLDPVEQQLAAASLAYRLMGIGVKAVVVAGWQVRDDLASRFATRLYEFLLNGVPYGDAVREARTACFNEGGATDNTWAAYQCYGDPGFRIVPAVARTGPIGSVATRAAANRELEELDLRAGEVEDPATLRSGAEELEAEVLRRWPGDGRLWSACGRLWADLGDYHRAVECYDRAVKAPDGSAPLSALEQLANLRSRDAVQRLRAVADLGSVPEEVRDAIDQAFKQVLLASEMLTQLEVPTSERSAIDGATYKRLAIIAPTATRREESMGRAIERYVDAFRLDPDHDLYGFRNALQLCAIDSRDLGEPLCESSSLERWAADIVRDQGIGHYFERAGRADSRLTALLIAPESSLGAAIRQRIDEWTGRDPHPVGGAELRGLLDADVTAGLSLLVKEYVAVRTGGYMIRNWRSTVEHIWELAFLASEPVKTALTQLHQTLPHT